MLADLAPLLTETIQHLFAPERDLFGNIMDGRRTEHLARVTATPGSVVGPASASNMAETAATIWLLDHPRPVCIGDVFRLADGSILKTVRVERRALGGSVLSKVFVNA